MEKSKDYSFENIVEFPSIFYFNIIDAIRPIPLIERPFVNTGFFVGICTDGTAKIRVNFSDYIFSKNSLLVVLPFSSLECKYKSTDFKLKMLYFPHKIVSNSAYYFNEYSFISKIMRFKCFELGERDIVDFLEFYDFVVRQVKKLDVNLRTSFSEAFLKCFLIKVKSIYGKQEVKVNNSSFGRITDGFAKVLIENYRREHDVNFYADKLCVTPKHLSFVVKKQSGYSASFWIKKMLLSEAKFLLNETELNVFEISQKLNFPTASAFGRFFKKNEGVSPFKYRNKS